jgi:quercetin dioxygenase-like cupin family protein
MERQETSTDAALTASVRRLAGLVDYQTGSVVSRTLLKRSAGTVTLFAFDAAEGLSEHTAPFDALVALLEGRADITISGKPFQLGEGEAIIMPAGQPHSLSAAEPFKMLLIMVRE